MKIKITVFILIILGMMFILVGCPDPIFSTTAAQRFPNIDVTADGYSSIVSGDTTVDFGTTTTSLTMKFTIRNTGDATLDLTGTPIVDVMGDIADDGVTYVYTLHTPPTTPIKPDGTTDFVIDFVCVSGYPGKYNGTITIPNNDPSDNNFNFNVTGITSC